MGEVTPSKYVITAGWDDVPHLDDKAKKELMDSTPPYLREARSKGIPTLGSGAIYPISESEIVVAPFAIPPYFRRVYGLDVGWRRTACIWLAHDPSNDVAYAYTEHYRGEAEPTIHATAIKARGAWIPGVIDPAARGRLQDDGKRIFTMYQELDLRLSLAKNEVEAGLYAVWERLSQGRLKIFSTMPNTLSEYRGYHRDEKGKIVKEDDHLMDALRYAVLALDLAIVEPVRAYSTEFKIGDPIAGY